MAELKVLNEILERLTRIEERLTLIEMKNQQLTQYGQKMDHHINFVNGVYQIVKKPFHGIMSYVGQSPLISAKTEVPVISDSSVDNLSDDPTLNFDLVMKNQLLIELSEDA